MHSGPIQIPGRPKGKYTPRNTFLRSKNTHRHKKSWFLGIPAPCADSRSRAKPAPSATGKASPAYPGRPRGCPAMPAQSQGAASLGADGRDRPLGLWPWLWLGLGADLHSALRLAMAGAVRIFGSGGGLSKSDFVNLPKGPFILKAAVPMTSFSAT